MAGLVAANNGLIAGFAFGLFCLVLSSRESKRKLSLDDVTRHAGPIFCGFVVGLLIHDWDDAKAGFVQGLIDGGL